MTLLVAGLVLFLGIHLVPVFRALRLRLESRLGERAYRAVFSLVSAVGLVLIVAGWWTRPTPVQIFAPLPEARAAAPLLVSAAFVLLAAANMRTHIRAWLRHPMLIGVVLWSGVHLLVNGDVASTVLFGSFLGWALIDLVSVVQRRAVKIFVPAWSHDVMAVGGGLVLAWLTMRYHAQIFGVAAAGG